MTTLKESLRADLDGARAELLALVERTAPAVWARRTKDGWNIVEELGHIADSEQGLRSLIRFARMGLRIRIPAFGVHLWNGLLVRARRAHTTTEALRRLERERAQTLKLLGSLSTEELDKRIYRPMAGATTIQFAFRRIAEHEREHTQAIRSALSQEEGT